MSGKTQANFKKILLMLLPKQYIKTRKYTETLCQPLEIEDYLPQAMEYTSPVKWHLGHVSWFFEELILKRFLADYTPFQPDFGFIFNSYYQSLGKRATRIQRSFYTRPTVKEVYKYRQYVDKHMQKLLETPVSNKLKYLTNLGINHEQQHQELLITDLKYLLSLNILSPVYDENFNLVGTANKDSGWLNIPEGIYEIGYKDNGFCYDNELSKHKVFLPNYLIAKSLVTNGEYLDFMEDGAYSNFTYWLDDAWTWISKNNIKQPLYWQKINGEWFYYTLSGLKPLDKNAILSHISFYEANAFASWSKKRLPNESEWEAACSQFKWGQRWEWTSSAYQAYPGFKISKDATGEYNGKFMTNQIVLRGASVATSEGHSRYSYRNFFYPYMQWQYAGIRLVK